MKKIHAKRALLPQGWAKNVFIDVAQDGRITHVEANYEGNANHQVGILVPAPVNAHSHAFQRAMAGLTEKRGPNPKDTFWTWRQLMFRYLDNLTPEHVEAIAAFVQMEMLEAGYATNVEFHYLHHQPGGKEYDNIAEMAARISAAASTTGIGLTLLPVHYQYGGCDKRALSPGQIRFGNDIDGFANLFQQSAETLKHLPQDTRLGVAPHSLRAVDLDALNAAVTLADNRPIHMHLAEQLAEVEEVKAHWGRRPVDWALEHLNISSQWCLIHCTQMRPHEAKALAQSGAVAGLCPITESSLGDGIFDGVNWLNNDGKIAIGSDSNIRISLAEEIRTLDYSQRLRDNSRAALATQQHSTGRRIFDAILQGGAQAAGRECGAIETGKWADLLAFDDTHVDFIQADGDRVLDCFAFAGDNSMISDVWAAGRHQVQQGRHVARDIIVADYSKALKALAEAI